MLSEFSKSFKDTINYNFAMRHYRRNFNPAFIFAKSFIKNFSKISNQAFTLFCLKSRFKRIDHRFQFYFPS